LDITKPSQKAAQPSLLQPESAVAPDQLVVLTINVVDTFGNDNSALPFNEDVIAQ